MIEYKVTSHPTYCNGDEARFSLGDVVRVSDNLPDEDGDVHAYRGSDPDEWNYIALKCLTPLDMIPDPVAPRNDIERVSVAAVRAVLALWGVPAEEVGQIVDDIARVDTAFLA